MKKRMIFFIKLKTKEKIIVLQDGIFLFECEIFYEV